MQGAIGLVIGGRLQPVYYDSPAPNYVPTNKSPFLAATAQDLSEVETPVAKQVRCSCQFYNVGQGRPTPTGRVDKDALLTQLKETLQQQGISGVKVLGPSIVRAHSETLAGLRGGLFFAHPWRPTAAHRHVSHSFRSEQSCARLRVWCVTARSATAGSGMVLMVVGGGWRGGVALAIRAGMLNTYM